MAVNVTMPKLGLTMETGKIIEWKKQEGEQVQEKEILLVVETEKITYDVESPATGILHIISPVESEVPVAELIGIIATDKAEYDKVAAGTPAAAPAAAAEKPAAAAAPQPEVAKVVPISTAKTPPAVDASKINLVVIGGGPGGYPAAIRAAQIHACHHALVSSDSPAIFLAHFRSWTDFICSLCIFPRPQSNMGRPYQYSLFLFTHYISPIDSP